VNHAALCSIMILLSARHIMMPQSGKFKLILPCSIMAKIHPPFEWVTLKPSMYSAPCVMYNASCRGTTVKNIYMGDHGFVTHPWPITWPHDHHQAHVTWASSVMCAVIVQTFCICFTTTEAEGKVDPTPPWRGIHKHIRRNVPWTTT